MGDPRFPIGEFAAPEAITAPMRDAWISVIASAPGKFRDAVVGLSDEQLDTPYRDGGWTVRQVVHHMADSHMNSLIRFKLALTEASPTIKPYAEDRWAELVDGKTADVELSLRLLDCVHARWEMLVRSFSDREWQRTFNHPERGVVRLDATTAMYAWHCDHHLAHITELRKQKGW